MRRVKEEAQNRNMSEAELLRSLFEKHKSQTAIARELGITQGAVSIAFLRCGLRIKTERKIEVVAS